MMQRRGQEDPTGMGFYHNWSWCWPVNRRVLYNRASVDLNGKPWNPEKPVISWNDVTRKWEGDVPDGGWVPMSEDGTKSPFIMVAEGLRPPLRRRPGRRAPSRSTTSRWRARWPTR